MMKKSICAMFAIASALVSPVAGHLYAANPNRVFIKTTSSEVPEGYLAERVEKIYFDKVEGRVAADVTFKGYDEKRPCITIGIGMTEDCEAYRLTVAPTATIAAYKDGSQLSTYLEQTSPTVYREPVDNAEITGFETLVKGGEYSVVTVAYDKFGIPCEISRADFQTPQAGLVGNPSVTCTPVEVGYTTATFKFVPNSDVSSYYFCLFDAGQIRETYEQFGPMFGYASISDMIAQWGVEHGGEYTHTYTKLDPGKKQEIAIAVKDANGNFGPWTSIEFTPLKYGGTGIAEVIIDLGDFIEQFDESSGQWLYGQQVYFTPNKETSMFRDMVIEKEAFESNWGEDKIREYLLADQPGMGWNHYETDEAVYSVKPSTDYYAFAIGCNINDEWGPLAKEAFSTPGAKNKAAGRNVEMRGDFEKGRVPVLVRSLQQNGKTAGKSKARRVMMNASVSE